MIGERDDVDLDDLIGIQNTEPERETEHEEFKIEKEEN